LRKLILRLKTRKKQEQEEEEVTEKHRGLFGMFGLLGKESDRFYNLEPAPESELLDASSASSKKVDDVKTKKTI
jgi:hypothetical protein